MIKHRKKAVSILLSAVMILTMWIPVSAAGENDLTLTVTRSGYGNNGRCRSDRDPDA